jgi:hypothetical protein
MPGRFVAGRALLSPWLLDREVLAAFEPQAVDRFDNLGVSRQARLLELHLEELLPVTTLQETLDDLFKGSAHDQFRTRRRPPSQFPSVRKLDRLAIVSGRLSPSLNASELFIALGYDWLEATGVVLVDLVVRSLLLGFELFRLCIQLDEFLSLDGAFIVVLYCGLGRHRRALSQFAFTSLIRSVSTETARIL